MTLNISSIIDYDNETNASIDTSTGHNPLALHIIFYIFLLLDIPSVLCSFLLFYYFLRPPGRRQPAYSNQMIIYLLISAFLITTIDIPFILPYLQQYYYIASMKYPYTFCVFWLMYDYITWAINLWLMALFSIERYLLIFFKQLVMKTKTRRFFLYYVPVSLIVVFIFCWYLYLVALYPCTQSQFDYTQVFCDYSCYESDASAILQDVDWIISALLPVFLTLLFTLILILHVLYQRHKISRHLMQRETWTRTRKMFLQLLPITGIFLVSIMPLTIIGLLGVSDPWYSTTPYFYALFPSYCLSLCIPFIILFKQKVVLRRLLTLFQSTRGNRIALPGTKIVPIRLGNNQSIGNVTAYNIQTTHT